MAAERTKDFGKPYPHDHLHAIIYVHLRGSKYRLLGRNVVLSISFEAFVGTEFKEIFLVQTSASIHTVFPTFQDVPVIW